MPIVQEMHRMLIEGEVIHAHETVFQVLHEEGRKATTNSRMWVYCNGKINDRSNIIFDYHPTRKSENAVRYTLNEKKYLYTFLEDGDVPIDNNRAENAIRPFTVGRKNWLFNNTARGAKCSALLYSIISTAQANGLDVEKYLTDLFSNSAGTILLPWND